MELVTDLTLVLPAALGGGLVSHQFRQPMIVGYILAGVVVGPFTGGLTVAHEGSVEQLAELGVALLLFSLRLEVSFRELSSVRAVAIGGAAMQRTVAARGHCGGGDAIVPRLMAAVARWNSPELFLIATTTVALGLGYAAWSFGLSLALGHESRPCSPTCRLCGCTRARARRRVNGRTMTRPAKRRYPVDTDCSSIVSVSRHQNQMTHARRALGIPSDVLRDLAIGSRRSFVLTEMFRPRADQKRFHVQVRVAQIMEDAPA